MEIGSYFELRSHAGIYSLGSFETAVSSGWLISTNDTIFRLSYSKNLTRLDKIPFFKIGVDAEIIGIAGTATEEYYFTAIALYKKDGTYQVVIYSKEVTDESCSTEQS